VIEPFLHMSKRWAAVVLAAFVVACGAKIEPTPDSGTGNPVQVKQQSIDKIDLLFAIDNSASMGDKQDLLALAIPVLVGRLLNPNCVASLRTRILMWLRPHRMAFGSSPRSTPRRQDLRVAPLRPEDQSRVQNDLSAWLVRARRLSNRTVSDPTDQSLTSAAVNYSFSRLNARL